MIKVDGPFYASVENAAEEAVRMRDLGYDGVYTMEGNSDPFFPLVIAADPARNPKNRKSAGCRYNSTSS